MPANIDGLEKLIRGLNELGGMKAVRATMRGVGLYVKGKIAKYPPASEANTPNQRRWYQRGWGSKWMRKDGSVNGIKSSETLGKRWTAAVVNDGLGAEVGNNTSYGPYVQDRETQASFHEGRGWATIQDIAEDEADNVQELIRKAIQAELDRIARSVR